MKLFFQLIIKEDIQALNTGEYGQQFVPVNRRLIISHREKMDRIHKLQIVS